MIKVKRYSGCIGASPLSQLDFFSLPMIELCDIFSLDSPLKQKVLCDDKFLLWRQVFPANAVIFWLNGELHWRLGKSSSGEQWFACGNGISSQIPVTRGSTSMVFTTNVKEGTWSNSSLFLTWLCNRKILQMHLLIYHNIAPTPSKFSGKNYF